MTSAELSEVWVAIYDLRDAAAWQQARRDRRLWGRLYCDVHALDSNHVALVLRSAGPRWHAWEAVRREWILGREHDMRGAA